MKFAFSTVSCPKWDFAAFASAGIEIACLSSSVQMTGKKKQDIRQADTLRTFIDTAQHLGCPLVRVFDTSVRPGQTRDTAGVALGDWLMPLGDYAAGRN